MILHSQLMSKFCTVILLFISISTFASSDTLLLREPDINGETLVFTYGQEIWQADLKSLNAKRISSFQGQASNPKISPDGKWIAFTGQYAGNFDVFVVAVGGGVPKQLTWHPGRDEVKGWASNSQAVIFGSGRNSMPSARLGKFWQVNINGTTPTALPMIRAETGSMSPDSKQFVYQKITPWDDGWRKYRGGQNNPLRLLNLSSLKETPLPWEGEKITDPQWEKEGIYFLSDKNDVVNIFKLDETTQSIVQLSKHEDYDVKSYGVDGDTIVYEQHGRLFALKSGKSKALKIKIAADFPWANPHWTDVSKHIESAHISPNGKRAIFVARGEVFTAPAKDGDIRNVSTTDARELAAAWSHDGQSLAWFSDASGEYRIIISDQMGVKKEEIKLAEQGFYYDLSWSPDDKKLLYTDEKQKVWWLDIAKQKRYLVAQDARVIPTKLASPSWSPDSNWIAYVKTGANFLRNIYIYSLNSKESHLLTDGMADHLDFAWDSEGKYLYFTASTDFSSKAPWLDLSIQGKKDESYSVYAAILASKTSSPISLKQVEEELAKEDKEKDSSEKDETDNKGIENITIDLKGLNQRIVPLPIKAGRISNLASSENSLLYLTQQDQNKYTLMEFSIKDLKEDSLAEGVSQYYLASNRKALLVQQKDEWKLVESKGDLKDAKALKLQLSIWHEPKKEWQQKFREAWRYQRDFFYVKNIHGANWDQVYKDYLPLVEHINHPADLTYLLDNIGAETSVGHSFTRNGALPDIPKSAVGLLGIDVEDNRGQFAITKIYTGENWNAELSSQAPMSHVKDKINIGDIILAVNGRKISSKDNFYQVFNGTLGQQTRLTIGTQGSLKNVQDVWVKPVASDSGMRQYAWIEDNRRYVEQKSKGQLAYIWVPNTSTSGYEYFNRYFFAQADKKGAIIDERFNSGGSIADYYIDVLNRKLSGYFNNQMNPNSPLTSPGAIIDGPKVLLINEMAGSGGDMFPYLFRFHKIGKLIGKTTWGGLVGIWGVPSFVDGGAMTAPRSGFYNLAGQWKVENEGVKPDIDVDENTLLASKGIDAQLKRAVEEAMKDLQAYQDVRQKVAPKDPVRAVTH